MVFSLTGLFLVSGVLRAGLETIKDHSLKQALDREDVSSSGILMIEDHLKAFPGTFRIENNEYGADLSRLVKYRQRLLLSLRNHHKYKQAYKNGVSLKHYQIHLVENFQTNKHVYDDGYLIGFSKTCEEMLSAFKLKRITRDDVLDKLEEFILKQFSQYHQIAFRNKDEWNDGERSLMALYEHAILMFIFFQSSDLEGFWQKDTTSISLKRHHLMVLKDSKGINTMLGEFFMSLSKRKRKKLDGFIPSVVQIVQEWMAHFHQTVEVKKEQLEDEGPFLNLFEVQPDLATLRGYVGGDSSTSSSFGVAYSPFEKVFYIQNMAGEYIAYLSFSIVNSGSEKVLYLHTIAGPYIDSVTSELVVASLDHIKEIYQAKRVLLPVHKRMIENNNYMSSRIAMEKSVHGDSEEEEMEWLDAGIRKLIGEYGSDMHYDSPERNQKGRRMESKLYDKIKVVEISSKMQSVPNHLTYEYTKRKGPYPVHQETLAEAETSCRSEFLKFAQEGEQ